MSKEAFKKIRFEKGDILFREGQEADYAYIIREGSVRISKRGPSGKNIPIALVEKGGIVGEMAIVSKAPRSATVTAHETVEALAISKQSFEHRLESIDPFLHSLIKTVIVRLRKTSDHTVNLYEQIRKQTPGKPVSADDSTGGRKSVGFSNVNFILADPNPQTRNSLRGGLFGLGFKEICDVSTLFQVDAELKKNQYDLLIIDAAFGAHEVGQFINDIRHGKNSKNPFLSIVVLTQDPSIQNHRYLLHSGSDTVLQKPLSVHDIASAVKTLCRKQREFIVTHNYTGPDRLSCKNPTGENAPRLNVPNTLAAKVLEGAQDQDLKFSIHDSMSQFNEIKIERNLVQLAWLMDQMSDHTSAGFDLEYILDCADRVLEDLSKRADNSRFERSSTICDEMRTLVTTLRQSGLGEDSKLRDMTLFYKELCENLPLARDERFQHAPVMN